MKKKIILVTGGAGYIGSHTIVEILEQGKYDVVSIDNFSNSYPEVFKQIKKLTGLTVPNYAVDLTDRKAIDKVFKKYKNIETVIHFAAFKAVGESVEKPTLYYRNNIDSLVNILDCVEKYKIPFFVFSSSAAVYGASKKMPVREDMVLPPAESPYGATKQMGEVILKDFAQIHPRTKITMLRYFNPVGVHKSSLLGEHPRGAPMSLAAVIINNTFSKSGTVPIFGSDYKTKDGTCLRDYIHVSDIARAHLDAILYMKKKGSPIIDTFNLGSGKGVTVLELIRSFEKATGISVRYRIGPRRPGDAPLVYADCSKAHRLLKWKPKHSLEEGMRAAWNWKNN